MCTVCGCGEASLDNTLHDHAHQHRHSHEHSHGPGLMHSHPHDHAHIHPHEHGHDHSHSHDHDHDHHHADDHPHHSQPLGTEHQRDADPAPTAGGPDLHFGTGPAGAHVPGLSQARMVQIEQNILGKNAALAAVNRRRLSTGGTLALNLVSSPGSGKTTLLVRTLQELFARPGAALPVAVIEGDQQTSMDADRIRATGAPAVQINTGKGCHLDAHMVGHALDRLESSLGGVLFIENVGNLVCPAAFDLGEAHKVVMLSVTEGEDKPLKYPDMFAAADLMLLTKADLLPYVSFDVAACLANARRVNPTLDILQVSATTGAGLAGWLAWIDFRRAALQSARGHHDADPSLPVR